MAKTKSKKQSKKQSKASKKEHQVEKEEKEEKVVEPTPKPEVEDVPTDNTSEATSEDSPVTYKDAESSDLVKEQLEALSDSLKGSVTGLRESLKNLKGLSSLVQKRIRFLERNQKKKRKQTDASGGFNKPIEVSKKLLKWLNKPEDTLISRVEVNRHMFDYIKSHGLEEEKDRRWIVPDDSLSKLLGVDDRFHYFRLQTYLKPLMKRA
jgi:chromatin remodeling complex protein RSC6